MRCVYCRPDFDRNHNPTLLSPDEIEMLVRHLVEARGVRKVRLTGGDPTARPDLLEIIERIAAIPGVSELAMTTNGLSLSRMAQRYADAGMQRVNVSLDSLDAEQFARMTGVDGLDRVLAGIDAALSAGLTPLKINTVVLRDDNEQQLPALVEYAVSRGAAIRFIELMPMGPLADRWAERYVPADRMRGCLESIVADWRAVPQGADSALRYDATLHDGRRADIGFITPMSCNFCSACNRIRITAEGTLYPCLMDKPAGSLLRAIRPVFDTYLLDELLEEGLRGKAPQHPVEGFVTMTHIGG